MKIYLRNGALFLALVLGLGSLGCGENVPTEANAKVALERLLGKNYTVIDFHKTDGVAQELFGVKGYRLEYSCKLRKASDTIVDAGMYDDSGNKAGRTFELEQFLQRRQVAWWNRRVGDEIIFRVGDEIPVVGSVMFFKSEKGWARTSID